MYILWDGVELDKSKAAVQNLQRMIWGLESFRVFDAEQECSKHPRAAG